jgi:myo-inositol-1(or 4)-monophosphatase
VRDYNDLVKVAERAAQRAAKYLRTAQRPGWQAWTEKAAHDFVTDIDRACETMITEALTRDVPGSRVVGEELAPNLVSGDVVWIVDPLDGTTNYLHGYQEYSVSIGCAMSGALCAGVIHDVPRNHVYRAWTGGGAWLGDARLAVSTVTDPKRALVATGFPFRSMAHLDRYLRQFAAVARAVSGIRRAGSAALDFANLAAGRFDAFWEQDLAPWDIAAGIVLIREAGGKVTRQDGSDDVLGTGDVVAGNQTMHPWMLNVLRNA